MAPHSKVASPRSTPTDVSSLSTPLASTYAAPASNPFHNGSKIPLPNTGVGSATRHNDEGHKSPSSTHPATPYGPRPQMPSTQQSGMRKSHKDPQIGAKTTMPLSTKRSSFPRTQHKDKPLPSTPVVNITASSPDRNRRTLLDATEHPPLRQSPGTMQEKDWPSLSPEKSSVVGKHETRKAAGSTRQTSERDATNGRSEALAALSTPATPRLNAERSKSSPSIANRATVATFHKATLVDHNSPELCSRRSIHISSPTKTPTTPSKQRRLSDPGSPPSSIKNAADRVKQMPHVQILTIQEEADRVIFGSPPRKPAFNEIRNLNRMQASGDEGSGVPASGSSKHGSPAVEAPSSRRINTTAEVQGYEHGVAVSSRDTTLNHVAGAIRDAIDDYNGKDEEDQRGRSAESTPTKASSHQRAPTPHSNMMFASRTTAGASAPMKAEMAPLTSNESTTAAATSATNPIKTFAVHPPRSDSLRDMRAAAARTQAVSTATSSANEMSKPTAAAAFRKLPHPVAESSFEAFLTKAKSTILDSIPSSERNPSQMLPEIQGPHPLKTFSAQGTPAEHSTAFSSFQDEESTSSGRMTRRDTNTTASGSQLTGQESHRSRSRGRRVITNLKDMFHRRAAENKEPVPPLPARSISRKHISPLHITKAVPVSSTGRSKLTPPSPRSVTSSNLNVPNVKASPPFRRDISTFTGDENTTTNRKRTKEPVICSYPSNATPTAPGAPSKPTSTKPKKEDPVFRLTSTAYALIDRVKSEPDHAQKESMFTTAQLAMDCVANAREAEKAMHKAQQAAKEAEISYQLVEAGVGEVGRMLSGMNFEKTM